MMSTPSRKRPSTHGEASVAAFASAAEDGETPSFFGRLFSSKKKRRLASTPASSRFEMIPSPTVVAPKLNLTAAAPVREHENAPPSPALPQFNIGSYAKGGLPSRARRGKTYYKPTTKTFIHYTASQRNSNLTAAVDNDNDSSLRAKLLQQCKASFMNTAPVAATYRTLPGKRILGTNQTNSRLTLQQQQEVAVAAAAAAGVASIKDTATAELASPPITHKKSVTFDSMMTPAVPKIRLARTQTPAAVVAPGSKSPSSASSPSCSPMEPNVYDIDGPFIFGSNEPLPSPPPLAHTFLYSPVDYGTREPSTTDLTHKYEPQRTITLEERDYQKKKINKSQFATDEDVQEAASDNQEPDFDTHEPKKLRADEPQGWGALPNMQKLTENKWKCKTCLGSVPNSLTVCGSCDTPRFPADDTATFSTDVKSTVTATGGFTFGGAPPTAPAPATTGAAPTTTGGFTFGAAPPAAATAATTATTAPAPAATGGFKFGSGPTTPAPVTTGGFTFGAAPPAAAATPAPATTGGFTIGAAPASTTTTTSAFTFGTNSTAAAAETPATAGFVFGGATPAKVNAVETKPIEESKSTTPQFPLNFGTTAPQTEPKKKRSAVVVPEAPKTEIKPLERPGFKFGAAPNSFPPPSFPLAVNKDKDDRQSKKRRGGDDNDQDDAPKTAPALAPAGSGPAAFSSGSTPAPAFGSTSAGAGTHAPAFSFGAPAPVGETPSFSFGAPAPPAPAPVGGNASFSFGAPVPAAVALAPVGGAPSFSVGASAAPAPVGGAPSFSFGASAAPAPPPVGGAPSFSFGASTAAPAATSIGGAPSFSFGASAAAPAGPSIGVAPSFSFGASAAAPAIGGAPSFSFGASTAAPAAPSIGGAPSFSFGTSAAVPAAPSIGGAPSFSFGASASAPAAPVGGAPSFSFGASAAAPAAPVGGAPSFGFSSQPRSSAPSPVPTAAAGSFGGPPAAPSFGATPVGFGGGSFGGASTTVAAPSTISFGFVGGTSAPAAASFGGYPPVGGFGGPSTPAANFGTPQAPGGFSIGTGGSTKGSARGGRRIIRAKRPAGTQ